MWYVTRSFNHFVQSQLSLVTRVDSLDVRNFVTVAIMLAWRMKDLYDFPLIIQARGCLAEVLVDVYDAC